MGVLLVSTGSEMFCGHQTHVCLGRSIFHPGQHVCGSREVTSGDCSADEVPGVRRSRATRPGVLSRDYRMAVSGSVRCDPWVGTLTAPRLLALEAVAEQAVAPGSRPAGDSLVASRPVLAATRPPNAPRCTSTPSVADNTPELSWSRPHNRGTLAAAGNHDNIELPPWTPRPCTVQRHFGWAVPPPTSLATSADAAVTKRYVGVGTSDSSRATRPVLAARHTTLPGGEAPANNHLLQSQHAHRRGGRTHGQVTHARVPNRARRRSVAPSSRR